MAFNTALKLDTSTILGGQGSIYATVATCTASGSLTSAVYSMPVSKDFELNLTTSQTTTKDEAGNNYENDDATTGTCKFTLLQQDAATRTFAKDNAGGYVMIMKELGVSGTGKVSYVGFVGKVKKSFTLKNPGGETPVELSIPNNTAAITVNGTTMSHPLWKNTAPGNITIAAGAYAGIIETTYTP